MKIVKFLALSVLTNAYAAQPVGKLTWPDYVDGQFVVKLKSDSSLLGTLANSGLKFKQSINESQHVMLVERNRAASIRMLGLDSRVSSQGLDRAIRRAMVQSQRFAYVEPNYIYKMSQHTRNGRVEMMQAAKSAAGLLPGRVPNDPKFSELWGMQNFGQKDSDDVEGVVGADIDATAAWELGTGSKDVVVAIVDTGIDYNHSDLVDNIWSGPNPDQSVGGVIHGYNAINNTFDPMDDNEHGTHCAGTIGGVGDNGVGVAGVNWNVSLMAVKILDSNGGGDLAGIIRGIDFATDQGVDVMSNSWGGVGYSEALFESIQRASDKGIVFVAAAGNDTNNNDSVPFYPASYPVPNLISVAATTNKDVLATFSSYGKRSVHVAAPGHNIVSTTPHDTYSSFSGTSMATPHVAGAVALFKSQRGAQMNPTEIRNEIMKTSERISAFGGKVARGGSRLNLHNLLANVAVPGPIEVPDDQWSDMVASVIESEHPYKDSFTQEWRVTQADGRFMRLHFSQFDTEQRYDTVTVSNALTGEVIETFSGALGSFVTDQIEATEIVVTFSTDGTVNKTGFVIDGYSTSTYSAPSTTEL